MDIAPFGIRMPQEVKEWVHSQATKDRMSMNSWLVRLIEKTKDAKSLKEPA